MIILGVDPGANAGLALIDTVIVRPTVAEILSGKFKVALPTVTRAETVKGIDAKKPLPPIVCEMIAACDVIAGEAITEVYSRARFGASMAKHMIAGEGGLAAMLEFARAHGKGVETFAAGEVRKGLFGSARAPDFRIMKMTPLIARVDGIRLNAHKRDAIAVAVYCARVIARRVK